MEHKPREFGATAAEYVLILALIAIACIGAITGYMFVINEDISDLNRDLQGQGGGDLGRGGGGDSGAGGGGGGC